jgi:tryptophan halogenase
MSSINCPPIREVVIVGGGTAGWMTAIALARTLGRTGLSLTLVESEAIGTVGVGEATLPQIREFNRLAGIDESEMMARTAGTVKLGIEFRDWGRPGDRYMHPFGTYGETLGPAPFHQHWLADRVRDGSGSFSEYSLPIVAAWADRFEPSDANEGAHAYNYAFQFDASLYARFLSDEAQALGVERLEGRIVEATRESTSGDIASITLHNGVRIGGDLFIDCSGFRALLIQGELATGFDDWSQWLPCNRAWAVPCANEGQMTPFTRATARPAGWQWRIPLQHRVGNGHVYCDQYMSDDDALHTLLTNLEADPIAEPRQLRFTTGKRRRLWDRNVVAIGLSGGFLEPLESTSIDLIQSGILNLIELFPANRIDAADITEYNRLMDLEYDRIRDFLLLHYVANRREGELFWDDMRSMELPESLSHKIETFRARGLTPDYREGLFLQQSWLSVLIGQGIEPRSFDPRAGLSDDHALGARMDRLRQDVAARASRMPSHEDYIERSGARFAGAAR